ncbi:MAG TPA: hypothetical protein VNI55_03970 [Gaiellaceae bacterium]|nr:hypothetical protein [Gaiellaceae bacterium]
MSTSEDRLARRRRRRSPIWRPLAAVAAGLLVLIVGIAIGRALEDGPEPGGTRTSVRTLKPQPLPPAAKTVTVTVGSG